MRVSYEKALKEVYIIINNLPEELYIKVPISFLKVLKENMNKGYNISFKELEEKGYLPETTDIMALVYRDYLCDKETRKELLKESDKKEDYSNLFKQKDVIESNEVKDLVVVEEKWYKRIWNKIINKFFRKS